MVERNQKEQMKNETLNVEGTPAVAVQRSVRHPLAKVYQPLINEICAKHFPGMKPPKIVKLVPIKAPKKATEQITRLILGRMSNDKSSATREEKP